MSSKIWLDARVARRDIACANILLHIWAKVDTILLDSDSDHKIHSGVDIVFASFFSRLYVHS